jgi:hypothetical protein
MTIARLDPKDCPHARTDVFERKHDLVGVCLDCNFEFELTDDHKRTLYNKARYILMKALPS